MPALVFLKSCKASSLVTADTVPFGYVFATLFGGTGFFGRHIVRRLLDADLAVRIPSRHPDRAHSLFSRFSLAFAYRLGLSLPALPVLFISGPDDTLIPQGWGLSSSVPIRHKAMVRRFPQHRKPYNGGFDGC